MKTCRGWTLPSQGISGLIAEKAALLARMPRHLSEHAAATLRTATVPVVAGCRDLGDEELPNNCDNRATARTAAASASSDSVKPPRRASIRTTLLRIATSNPPSRVPSRVGRSCPSCPWLDTSRRSTSHRGSSSRPRMTMSPSSAHTGARRASLRSREERLPLTRTDLDGLDLCELLESGHSHFTAVATALHATAGKLGGAVDSRVYPDCAAAQTT
jgi:hypothetical protein